MDDRLVAQAKIIKLALSKQMDQTAMEAKAKKAIQIEQELEDANLIKAKYYEDKEATKQQKVDAAKHFKEIWEA